MGSFSIFHWVIVLLLFIVPIVLIILASADKTMSRGGFAIRVIVMFAIATVVGLVPYGDDLLIENLVITIMGLVFALITTVWSVHRLNEIGWSRWWALLTWVPFVNFVMLAVLSFKGAKPNETQAVST